jgi:Uma2 family endonuclease
VLVEEPSPNLRHEEISMGIVRVVGNHVFQNRLGWVFTAPLDVYLSEHNILQPDVLFVSGAREAILAEDGIRGAPDLVVEIVSESSARRDAIQKRRVYATAGVREYWLVYPEAQMVHQYRFGPGQAGTVRVVREDEAMTSPVLPGLTVAVREILGRRT